MNVAYNYYNGQPQYFLLEIFAHDNWERVNSWSLVFVKRKSVSSNGISRISDWRQCITYIVISAMKRLWWKDCIGHIREKDKIAEKTQR